MRKFEYIFLHCSDSDFGCTRVIDNWHKARGWSGIGYHFTILNGLTVHNQINPWRSLVGSIEAGRYLNNNDKFEIDEIGSHVYGFNSKSIGVCLIGKDRFSSKQFIKTRFLVKELMEIFNIPIENVLGHCEAGLVDSKYATTKTCPNFRMDAFRFFLESHLLLYDFMQDTSEYLRKIYDS